MSTDEDLNTYFKTALPLVKTCGRMIKDAYCKMQVTISGSDDHLFTTCNPTVPRDEKYEEVKTFTNKSCAIDWVTETDKGVEKYLIGSLHEAFPTHLFVGEETASTHKTLTDEPTWIIDPVDGTTNFVHGIPMCCTSVALAINKHVVLAIVYNPIQEELFTALRGRGAFMNGKRIHVSHTSEIGQAIIGTNPGYHREKEHVDKMLYNMNQLLERGVAGIKMIGNAAMDISYVACGRTDCFYEKFLCVWDYAAASLIVEEAGGVCKTRDGINPLLLEKEMVVFGNPLIAPQVFSLIKQ
ncbi:inositol monophosphatase, putative [Entamoeba invadens IP1]|uniref:Inositol-1-monophosphatase n=1 Tax=Entamoeba invadens IP1 TaxID=370355 RepID=A0A0A1U825_ENTIV|nr:inositol monophosphatase, putative [Entamoeba invadens IP1]ELP88118.1 inositol monophosphatase, putative [Entamoeba invadens IP1]|eukprot:XP_004254889.1 inositol monophosphatase, putative [Entamoeba invadens IP1]